MNVWLILLGIVVIAALCVVLPVAATTFSHYRRAWRLSCPADGATAQIVIDAPRAAIGAVLGRPTLEIARCSLWTRLRFCKQECLALRESEMHPVRRGAPAPGATPDARLRKILVPLDGSPGSTSVLWTVGQLARAQDARVRLLRVESPLSSVYARDGRVIAYADQEYDRVALDDLQGLKRTAHELAGVKVETAVRFGDPATQIVEEADETGADLIAMAAHRRAGVARLVKGSVAERVERATTVPLVLVPYGEPEESAR
jgi:nucleotide-binding universal stress UspA family protein